ncbi:hypothetical protein AB205_0103790, partial [Aquarana catesbeiana]
KGTGRSTKCDWCFGGGQPHKEWKAELTRLVQVEMRLDESYRALRWYVVQVCLWTVDDTPTEGFGYSSLGGLLLERLPQDPDFESGLEWRLEEISEYKERMLNVSEVPWARVDLEFLANQEWDLEIAYIQLLDSAQQQVWAPFTWDYQEIPADNSEILAEESAMWQSNSVLCQPVPAAIDAEVLWQMQQMLTDLDDPFSAWDDLGWRNASVQKLDEGTGDEAVCSSLLPQTTECMDLIDSSEDVIDYESPAKVLALGQSAANPCPGFSAIPETCDLNDFSAEEEQPRTSPAEALATGQRVQDLCPTSVGVPEAQGEKVAVTSQQQIRIQGEKVFVVPPQQSARVKEAAFPPQQRSVHLGDSTRDMSSQQPDVETEEEAAGSPPQWQLHSLGVEESSLLPQRLAEADDVESPAEVLATGQSATNLCPALATMVEFQGAGAVGPSLHRQANVVKLLLPAESLATGQSAAGLCLASTVSLQLQEAGVIGPSADRSKTTQLKRWQPERVNDLCPTPTDDNYSLQPRMEIMQTDYVSSLCPTNSCPDQVEVWDLVNQLLVGEKCDRLTRDRGFWTEC